MKYQTVLLVVKDIGANATLTGGITLQTLDAWQEFILNPGAQVTFRHNAAELYFEEENIDTFCAKLATLPDTATRNASCVKEEASC